jgi:hypothetical protein
MHKYAPCASSARPPPSRPTHATHEGHPRLHPFTMPPDRRPMSASYPLPPITPSTTTATTVLGVTRGTSDDDVKKAYKVHDGWGGGYGGAGSYGPSASPHPNPPPPRPHPAWYVDRSQNPEPHPHPPPPHPHPAWYAEAGAEGGGDAGAPAVPIAVALFHDGIPRWASGSTALHGDKKSAAVPCGASTTHVATHLPPINKREPPFPHSKYVH